MCNRPQPGKLPYKEFKKWHGHWYGTYAPELFKKVLRPGTVVVIDTATHEIVKVIEVPDYGSGLGTAARRPG